MVLGDRRMADISPTLAREDGRKFGESLVASKLEPVVRRHEGKVPVDVEEAAIAAIDEAVQETLLEKSKIGWSQKPLEIFRKQTWCAVEKGRNDLSRGYSRRRKSLADDQIM